MEEKDKLIDQSELASSVADKIPYEFVDYFLVKPLDPIKVKKEFSKPVDTGKKPTKDKNGIEAVDYDKVETEVKEVDSDFRKGVVLKVPYSYTQTQNDDKINYMYEIKIGDVVLFRDMAAKSFDLLKDSKLIKYYDIVAVEK